jgi:hypothetical protein
MMMMYRFELWAIDAVVVIAHGFEFFTQQVNLISRD